MNDGLIKVKKIPIEKVVPDIDQPRKFFDKDEIVSLAKSIQKNGLIQPIIVRECDDKYIIIAGERRYRAFLHLKMKEIDAIIKNSSNYRVLSLIENIQREDLKPLEEAVAIKTLIDENNYTHEEVGKIIGKSRPYISNKIRLLSLDKATISLLNEGKITEGHARALLKEKDIDKRKSLAEKILKEGISVRGVEKKTKKDNIIDEGHLEIEEILEDYLSTKVIISCSKGYGKIEIDYYSEDQLHEIIKKIYKSEF